MNLTEAHGLALDKMREHNLIQTGWHFEWNKRKRAAGLCSYGRRTIYLSSVLTAWASKEEVTDTILHEIAHALTPGHKHDWVWKMKAKEIGADGNRCFSEETKPNLAAAAKMVSKYKAVCKNGHEHYANKLTRRKRYSSCGRCSRTFNPNEVLIFTLNR